MADEPTGNLHSDQGKVIMELLQNLNKKEGMTIIQVTHSEENANYGNRIIRLEDAMITSETMSDSTKENAIVGA
jgi:ABC-type lipoprotein export system ATPase subunit